MRLKLISAMLILLSFVAAGCSISSPRSTSTEIIDAPIRQYPQPAEFTEAIVTRVIDGDTIEVNIDNTIYVVRYTGIDTPELNQPYYTEATNENRELVEGKTVQLEKDVSDVDIDGRLLRYVFIDNIFVNAELVRLGFAEAISSPPDMKYQILLSTLNSDAKNAERGIWAIIPTTPKSTTPDTIKTTPPPRN